jgi:hypothetical protein
MTQPEWEPIVIGAGRVCGWKARTRGGLWSRVNRAFCRLVHRARYEEVPSEAEQPVAFAA